MSDANPHVMTKRLQTGFVPKFGAARGEFSVAPHKLPEF